MHKVLHILLLAAVLLVFPLLYLLLLRTGHPILSPSQWLLFAGVALAVALAAFLPGMVGRSRGLSPQPISPSDIRFSIVVAIVLCPLAFFAVLAFGPFGSFVIMLVPIAFIVRSAGRKRPAPNNGKK